MEIINRNKEIDYVRTILGMKHDIFKEIVVLTGPNLTKLF